MKTGHKKRETWLSRLMTDYEKTFRIFYYAITAFSLWYWAEILTLQIRGTGLFLSYEFADAFTEIYFILVGSYAVETYFHERNRWGHYFPLLWFVTFIGAAIAPPLQEPPGCATREFILLFKITGTISVIWILQLVAKTFRHAHS